MKTKIALSAVLCGLMFGLGGCQIGSTSDDNTSVSTTVSTSEISVEDFVNDLNFTPVSLTLSDIESKKFVFDNGKEEFPVYFTSDGKFYTYGEGEYSVQDNVIVFYYNGKVDGYVAFSDFNGTAGSYTGYFENSWESGNVINVVAFDESTFDPYPSYVINGKKIILGEDDDMLNFDGVGRVQFNIKQNGVGVQCTTNYTSLEEFKGSFVNGELSLDAVEGNISCQYLNDDNPEITEKQTEVIQFIDNNDGSYQVHMTSGYFSGKNENTGEEFNITAIDDQILLFEDGNYNDYETLPSGTVEGKISFYDYNGKEVAVPYNTYVRIVPDKLTDEDNYDGINCKLNSDGTFGDNCVLHSDEALTLLENNETFQFAVYAEDGNDVYRWDKDEYAYFVDHNITLNDIQNFRVTVKRVYIGNLFNKSWFKTIARYTGDYRYYNSLANLEDWVINLYTTRVDGNETRSALWTMFDNATSVSSDVVLNEGGPYNKYKLVVSTNRVYEYENRSAGYYAGMSIKPLRISFWGGLYTYDGDVYEYFIKGCDLSSSIEKEHIKAQISSQGEIVTYTVSDENGNVLCQNEYNISDANISGDVIFNYARNEVQIDDDDAVENNETAGDEVNATVYYFQTN